LRKLLLMFRFVRPYKWRLFFFLYAAIGYSAFASLPLLLVREYLAIIIESRSGERFWTLVGLLLVSWLLSVYFFIRREIASQYLSHAVVRDATNRVMAHLLAQGLAFFDRQRTGELISRIATDSACLSRTVTIFTFFVREPLTILFVLGVLFSLNWKLTLLGLVGFPLAAWPTAVLGRKIRRASRRQLENAADRSHLMVQAFGGVRMVKGFGREAVEADKFKSANRAIFEHSMARARADASLKGIVELVNAIGMILVVIAGGLLCFSRVADFTPQDFLTFVASLALLHKPTRDLGYANSQVQEALPGAERLFQLLDVELRLPVAPDAVAVGRLSEAIRLRGVSFSYDREPVLDGVDIEIPAGRTTAIVGPSGSGKSTVVNLVARFYDPVSGSVEVDGLDLRKADPASWLAQLGLVTQEPLLFNTSIRENIRYGRLDATDAEVEEAARLACVHEEIVRLPEGYDTIVGERGSQLSGGQRQRVCLARALVRNPAVLLLDEATSSLDSASERQVQEAIEKAQAGRTTLVVAHRLSTVMNADRTYVLVGGRVEACGTHRELLEKSPTYRRLWELQQGRETESQAR